jgi:ketosteroid isomerase-like protein
MAESLSTVEKKLAEAMQRIDELEKRITVAEDIEQIKQLQIRYLTGHTLNDGEAEAEGFADDATFFIAEEPLEGKEAITKFVTDHANMLKALSPYTGPYELEKVPTDGHFILHPVISVDGDKATGTWMQYCLSSEPVTMQMLYYVQALYEVEYVKRNGRWQIYHMKWTPRIGPRH